ncbi:MAG: hypothetical protein J5806_14850 [Lentisphaeria bacterium]|nr:hypothetical protein [Lentisphaeria bacterium]
MKMRSSLLCLLAVLSGFSAVGANTDPTLNLTFERANEITVGNRKIAFDGKIQDGMMFFGSKFCPIPAAGLTGDKGTILAKLSMEPFNSAAKGARPLVTLRTNSRLCVSIYTLSNRQCIFGFYNQTKNIYASNGKEIKNGTTFYAAVTWNGERVRFYFNGKLLQERKQEVQVEKITTLNIGPFSDGWYKYKPWGDENRIGLLKVWNRELDPAEIQRECGVKSKSAPEQYSAMLRIPQARMKPVLDGSLDEDAWRQAASFSGLNDLRRDPLKGWRLPPNTFQYMWDADNLYLGFTTLFPNTEIRMGPINPPGVKNEVAWGFESFEFRILNGQDFYRFAGNVSGGRCASKKHDPKWSGSWTYKTRLIHRIDDRKLWGGEVAIPWKSIGLNGPPRGGLKLNFSRSWLLPELSCLSSSSWNGDYVNTDSFQYVWFESVPSMRILEQDSPEFGTLTQKVSFFAPKDARVSYEVAGIRMDGSIAPGLLFTKELALSAGKPLEETFSIPIRQTMYDALLFTFRQGNTLLMRQVRPFKLNEELFSLSLRFGQGKIVVKPRYFMIRSKHGGDAPYTLWLQDPAKKVIVSRPVTGDSPVEIPFDRTNPPGDYKLILNGRDDKVLLFEKQIHFPGFGEWASMKFDNRIIPPFTPLKTESAADGFAVSMWGRTYRWKQSLFPVSALSKGVELLKAPVELVANGKPLQGASVTVGKREAHRMEFTAGYDSELCAAVNRGWVEYDGVSYFKVGLTAKDDLQGVKLRIRIPTALARYLHASSTSCSWGAKRTLKIRPGQLKLEYYPMVWIGMEDKGLCFFTETSVTWKNRSRQVYLLDQTADETVLEISLADRLKSGTKMDFEFGLLASPVRPFPANYPCNFYTWAFVTPLTRSEKIQDLVLASISSSEGGALGRCFADLPSPEGFKGNKALADKIAAAHQYGVRFIPYNLDRYLSDEYPEVVAFREEWRMVPENLLDYNTKKGKAFLIDCCPVSSASAFYVWKFKKMLERHKVDGIYLDFGTIPTCSNAEHGCRSRTPYLAQREFYRRLCLVQLDAGIKDPVIMLHNTDTVQLPAMTFATHLFNGEHIRQQSSAIMHHGKDILDTYDVTMFASELGSMPFGLTNSDYQATDVLLPKYGGGKEDPELYKFRITKAFLVGALPHNTLPSGSRCHYGIFDRLLRVYRRFGVPDAQFIGYWENPARVSGGKDIYVSVYKRNGKALAVISHIGKGHEKQTVEIAFDAQKLGLKPFAKATDCMTAPDPDYDWLFEQRKKCRVPVTRAPLKLGDFGSKVESIQGGVLKLTLDYHSFAIVELE